MRNLLFSPHLIEHGQCARDGLYLLNCSIAATSRFALFVFILCHAAALWTGIDKLYDSAKYIRLPIFVVRAREDNG